MPPDRSSEGEAPSTQEDALPVTPSPAAGDDGSNAMSEAANNGAPAPPPDRPSILAEDDKTFTVHGPDPEDPSRSKTMVFSKADMASNPAVEHLYNIASANVATTAGAGTIPEASPNTAPITPPALRGELDPLRVARPGDDNQVPLAPATPMAGQGMGAGDPGAARGVTGTNTTGTALAGAKPTPYETTTEDQTHKMSAEGRKALHDASIASLDAVEAQAGAQKQQAITDELHATRQQQVLEDEVKNHAIERAQIQQNIDKRMGDVDRATADLEKMNIDPSKAFGEGVTFSKVLAGIGLALGALGSAKNGAPNQAIAVIDNAIKTDIEAQKANMEKQVGVVKARQGGLQTYMEVAKNKEAAIALETARQLSIVDKQFEGIAAANRGTVIDANLKAAQAEIKQKQADEIIKATGIIHVESSKSMLPSMMYKDLPPTQSAQIVGHETAAVNLMDIRDQIKKAHADGKDLTGLGMSLNDYARKFGADNTEVTALNAKMQDALLDRAKAQGFTRMQALPMVQQEMATIGDKPETAIKLLEQGITHEKKQAEMYRNAYGQYHRLPPSPGELNRASSGDIPGATTVKGGKRNSATVPRYH